MAEEVKGGGGWRSVCVWVLWLLVERGVEGGSSGRVNVLSLLGFVVEGCVGVDT